MIALLEFRGLPPPPPIEGVEFSVALNSRLSAINLWAERIKKMGNVSYDMARAGCVKVTEIVEPEVFGPDRKMRRGNERKRHLRISDDTYLVSSAILFPISWDENEITIKQTGVFSDGNTYIRTVVLQAEGDSKPEYGPWERHDGVS